MVKEFCRKAASQGEQFFTGWQCNVTPAAVAVLLLSLVMCWISGFWTDKLQRVMNAAARVITGTWEFRPCLTRFLHHDLHWLDVPRRITFELCLLVFRCLHGWLGSAASCWAVCTGRRRHGAPQSRSATRELLNFPRYNMKNYGRRAFSYAGPHAWNSLPEHLQKTTSIDLFTCSLKTVFIRADVASSALETVLLAQPTHNVGGGTSNDGWCLSVGVSSVVCNAAGGWAGRASGRSGGRHSTEGQYG